MRVLITFRLANIIIQVKTQCHILFLTDQIYCIWFLSVLPWDSSSLILEDPSKYSLYLESNVLLKVGACLENNVRIIILCVFPCDIACKTIALCDLYLFNN